MCSLISFQSLPRPRSSSGSSSRRKSSSQLSASLMVGQRSGVVDIHDSGIASQEDLSAAMLHTLQQYSSSAGSSPSHPPVGSSAICLPGRLTSEQCRLAEAAAHALVSREFAAAATAKSLQQTQQPQQPNILQCPPMCVSTSILATTNNDGVTYLAIFTIPRIVICLNHPGYIRDCLRFSLILLQSQSLISILLYFYFLISKTYIF